MPEYEGTIIDGELRWVRRDLLDNWCEKNNGCWFRAKLEILGPKTPKTDAQLGYYWGLLLPEINHQQQDDGITITVIMGGIKVTIPITKDATHEYLTASCGKIGPDGALLRLSEMDKYQTTLFVDNVLKIAIGMDMNEERLMSWRPDE